MNEQKNTGEQKKHKKPILSHFPNVLCFLRIALTPVFFVIFLSPFRWIDLIFIWILFVFMELSDFFDGYLARKFNWVSNVGKLLDPFADLFMHLTFFLAFYIVGLFPLYFFYVILVRELAMLFVRNWALQRHIIIQANFWGKLKTISYSLVSLFVLLDYSFPGYFFLGMASYILSWLSVCLCVFSFFLYLSLLLNKI